MTVFDNGYMEVSVDGRIERRRYSINRDVPMSNRMHDRLLRYEPQLNEGERAIYSLGSDIPTIVQGPYQAPIEFDDTFSRSEF